MAVTVYSKPACSECIGTKRLMKLYGIDFIEVDVTKDPSGMDKIMALGYRQMPVVVVDEQTHWAGLQEGKIEALKA